MLEIALVTPLPPSPTSHHRAAFHLQDDDSSDAESMSSESADNSDQTHETHMTGSFAGTDHKNPSFSGRRKIPFRIEHIEQTVSVVPPASPSSLIPSSPSKFVEHLAFDVQPPSPARTEPMQSSPPLHPPPSHTTSLDVLETPPVVKNTLDSPLNAINPAPGPRIGAPVRQPSILVKLWRRSFARSRSRSRSPPPPISVPTPKLPSNPLPPADTSSTESVIAIRIVEPSLDEVKPTPKRAATTPLPPLSIVVEDEETSIPNPIPLSSDNGNTLAPRRRGSTRRRRSFLLIPTRTKTNSTRLGPSHSLPSSPIAPLGSPLPSSVAPRRRSTLFTRVARPLSVSLSSTENVIPPSLPHLQVPIRIPLSPKMYTPGSIQRETHEIIDPESRRLSEVAFM